MMGPTHAMSGAALWFITAPTVVAATGNSLTPAQILVGGAICAGAAIVPDIDQPSSTVARSFGPLTWVLSKAVNAVSAGWYNLTRTSREPFRTDGHRTLTHSLLGCVGFSAGVAALCGWGGKWAALGLLFFLLGLAIRGLMGDWAKRQGWIITTVVAAGAAYAAGQVLPQESYWWLSLAVFMGTVFHSIPGDWCTKDGIPFVAPIPWRGKAWWEFAPPSFLRIRAGGGIEYGFWMPVFTLLAALGVWATLTSWRDVWVTLRGVLGV